MVDISDLRVHTTLVIRIAGVVGVVVKALLLDPLFHGGAWGHHLPAGHQLVATVLAVRQVGELAAHLVPLVPHQPARQIGQRLAPPQRAHPDLRPCFVVRVEELLARGWQSSRRRGRRWLCRHRPYGLNGSVAHG